MRAVAGMRIVHNTVGVMESETQKKQGPVAVAIVISLMALIAFLYQTKLLWSPVILFLIAIFLLFPYRKESLLTKRLTFLIVAIFIGWLLSDLGSALIPFFIAFLLAYLLEPLVAYLARKGLPRWLSSISILLLAIGILALIGIFVLPSVFSQLDTSLADITSTVSSVNSYIRSKEFYDLLATFGIDQEMARNTIEKEIVPKFEVYFKSAILDLTTIFQNITVIASQLINVILVPILSFYFLKDFDKLKNFLKSLLKLKNQRLLYDLRRINKIVRVYVTWQITAAMIVATVCSTFFSIFGLPYAVVLGIICGFLNPIPYLGVLFSYFVCALVLLFTSPDNVIGNIIVSSAVISVMHFINAYFLEPNIAGRQVGLHPLLMIASLFIFAGLFGFLGIFIAVPCTATLMMFFNDWRESRIRQMELME